jgi:small-conductance mechanosensitive channel
MLQRNFYLFGSLLFGGFVNGVLAWVFFSHPPQGLLFLRGNTPWLFYGPCLIATIIALLFASLFDRIDSTSQRSFSIVSLRVFTIFCACSIALNFLTFFFVGYGLPLSETLKNFGGRIHILVFFLLMGIPLCLLLGGVYLKTMAISTSRRDRV